MCVRVLADHGGACSLTPEVTTTTATTSAAAAAAASSETASPVAPSLTLDPAQPVTTLQLRLMDGTRY